MATAYKNPGRLNDPTSSLLTDPRTNPQLLAAITPLGLAANVETGMPFTSSAEEQRAIMAESSNQFGGLYEVFPNDLPEDKDAPKVERSDIEIDGRDGNKVKLHVFRRADLSGATLPAVVYIHGGGMTIIDTINKVHVAWLEGFARSGVVSIAIDFRNAYTEAKHNPFPAGLNDCVAGVKYIAAHRSELGIGKIVLQGESGGGNLSIATALTANREGWVKEIAGVYACVPYISGAYGWSDERKLKELPSLYECAGYILAPSMMAIMAAYYTGDEANATNPLAWPYFATEKDLKGLPPHILSMDELDPLRDEGMAFYRKLVAAGVDATAEVNLGVTHGSSLMFRKPLEGLHKKTIRHIVAFAKSF